MADRGTVIRPDDNRNTLTIGRRRVGDEPPDINPYETPSNRDAATGTRISSSRHQVEASVNATGATVPVIVGGPLPVGGYLIYCKQGGPYGFLYLDFAICEGPLYGLGSITNITIDGKTPASINASVGIHYGAAGDTTSSLISAVEAGYTIPEGIAHVVVVLPWPDGEEYNPFAFQATVKGLQCADLVGGGAAAWSDNPVRCAHAMLTSSVFGAGFDASTAFVTTEWHDAAAACDYDIDPGAGTTKRWQIALRIDSQDTVESWVTQVLDHCNGHLRHDGEKWGIWLDLPRSVAQAGGQNILFTDTGATANLSAKPTWIEKARAEIPTVVIVDYVDAAAGYVDSSVQVPSGGPSGDWIEKRYSRKGITTIERARRMATFLYNVNQLDRDVNLAAWMGGALPLEGDRVLCQSARLIPADQTPPNVSGATAGVEHLVITDQTVTPTGVTLRGSLYRDSTFSDTIDTSGGPTPPGQTPNSPDPPTNLVLTGEVTWDSGVMYARIKIEWTPAPEPFSSFTRITYSRDGTNFYELGTGFQDGPAYLENAELGVEHTFRLYTVRIATGQVSSALEGVVTPTYVDPTIPEVVQGAIRTHSKYGAVLEFYGPIPSQMLAPRNQAPQDAPTATASSGGSIPSGTYKVAYSRVTANTETHMSPQATVVLSGGNHTINISNLLNSDANGGGGTGVLYKKVYITATNGSQLYYVSDNSVSVTTSGQTVYNWALTADNQPPATADGIDYWLVLDNQDPANPTQFGPPIPVLSPPQRYARYSLAPAVYDAGGGVAAVDVLVVVVEKMGKTSAGKSYSASGTITFPLGR